MTRYRGWGYSHCLAAILACAGVEMLATGCHSTDSPPAASAYREVTEADRQTTEAERLSREAADLLATDPTLAEALLREALARDLFFGPAHNNLGVVFLKQGKLYEAANEFEWARKLMPGHPDPRVNLAITMERAGKMDDAIASYTAALDVYPGYLPAVQGMARVMLRSGQASPLMRAWLEDIALRGETGVWRDWARRSLALGNH